MKLYASAPPRRVRQVAGDLLVAGWVLLWLWVSRVVHDATMLLAVPGREIAAAGDGLADRLRDAGGTVGDLPLVGGEVRAPFDGAGDAAQDIAAAGRTQVEAVTELADWLGLTVAAVPILLVLAFYLPSRWKFVREATAVQRFVDSREDLDLFALRALSHQPMHRLARVSDDPAGDWRRGNPQVVRALAVLELRDAGLTPPTRLP